MSGKLMKFKEHKMKSRRRFLKTAVGASIILISPAVLSTVNRNERVLKFHSLHTGEELTTTYWENGNYIQEELDAINYILRDHRTGEIEKIDRALLDLLFALQNKLEKSNAYHIISGYRSPKTNAMLRRNSGGVAKRSYHMLGRAADIRLPGVDLKYLRKAALALHAGGVGYYPRSGFIHVDTGRPRFW
jgi:uncharacterized protein YcbK (DUF882 family)